MELIDAKITILVSADYTTIELIDWRAGITFARVTLTPEQLSSALSRRSHTDCIIELMGLNKIGKKHMCKTFEFPLPPDSEYHDKGVAIITAQKLCPEGWEPDLNFSSQNSFFYKDKELRQPWARTIIRKWE